MSPLLIIMLIFISLLIGIFIGKALFKVTSGSEKIISEEKINSLSREIDNQKQIFSEQKKSFENQIQQLNAEREKLLNEKQSLLVLLSKKETEYSNLLQKNSEQKQEVEELQAKFTKEFENLANKILEEKSNKFTEQNKENIKNILNPLQEKIQLFEKKVEDS